MLTALAALLVLLPQEEDPPVLRAGTLPADLVLDGVLDEPAWGEAHAIENLTMVSPREGVAPTLATRVRVLAGPEAIVVGIRCEDDEPGAIVSHSVQRDSLFGGEDRVRVVIGTFMDGRTGYVFTVNPSGARTDGLVARRGESWSSRWDGIWEVKTSVDEGGWTVEMRIPVRTLSFDRDLRTWHFNVERRVQRLRETSRWAGARRDWQETQTSHAGLLTGLPEFDLGLGLSLIPVATASYGRAAGKDRRDFDSDASLDLTQRLAPDLLLSTTFNTDFSETEVDSRRTNLTRFPLFFPEKRRFFLEGSDLFEFGLGVDDDAIPFHSRRIGLVGGNEVPLLAGAKLHGRIHGTQVGALGTYTDEEEGVAPRTGMGVFRVRQDVLAESSAGLLATVGDPLDRDDAWTTGADFIYQTSRLFGDKNFLVGAWGLTMDRDGHHPVDRSAWGVKIDYPNDVLDVNFVYKGIGEEFRPSLGFVPRPGIHRFSHSFDVNWWPDSDWFRIVSFEFRPSLVTDFHGHRQSWRIPVTPFEIDFQSGEEFDITGSAYGEVLPEDFEISEGVVIPAGTYTWERLFVGAETDPTRPVYGEIFIGTGDFYDGTLDNIEVEGTWKPFPLVTLSGSAERNTVHLPAGSFRSDIYTGRVRLNISPDLSASSFLQFDTDSRLLGTFSRLHWQATPGSDLFVVFTYNWREQGGHLAPDSYGGVVKLQYALRF